MVAALDRSPRAKLCGMCRSFVRLQLSPQRRQHAHRSVWPES